MSRPGGRGDRTGDITSKIGRWEPRDWDELINVWGELVPASANSAPADEPPRRFQGLSITPQEAGKVFERWIIGAFGVSGFDVEYPYRVSDSLNSGVLEEVDGLVADGWQGLLVQSKFWPKRSVDLAPLMGFHDQVRRRPATTLGLFFSAFPVSEKAVSIASSLYPIRFLLFQRKDIDWAIRRRDMKALLKLKWRCALKYGKFDYEVDRIR